MKTLDFGGSKEIVYERSDWPKEKFQEYFKNDTIAVIGYGPQGSGQGLNARDNGLNVIVGLREGGRSWKEALNDGWVCHYIFYTTCKLLTFFPVIRNLERRSFL